MSAVFLKRLKWFCFLIPALLLAGCSDTKMESSWDKSNPTDSSELAQRLIPQSQPSSYEFEPAMLLTAGGEKIRLEEPGYACPTLFDFDKDGSEDLIVGQFAQGKMKWYRNLSSPGETPVYAEGEWISSGDTPAEVPGVS